MRISFFILSPVLSRKDRRTVSPDLVSGRLAVGQLVDAPARAAMHDWLQGLTRHETWWPALYLNACQSWAVEPDPKVLAYCTTYENNRADLKKVSVSS